MNVANCITDLIGNTPMLRLSHAAEGAGAQVLAKLEYFNPASSVKDRAALSMIRRAEEEGALKPGGTIVEPTSGNTGIGIALVAATRRYHVILTMPESMSEERKRLLRGLGAHLVLTPAAAGMHGAIAEAAFIRAETEGAITLAQFDNPANPEAHYLTTAEEIWRDTEGQIDIFVSAVGTGGTLTGTASKLRGYRPGLEVVAVEPEGSPVLSGGTPAQHAIQGIGAGFVPGNFDSELVDRVMQISDDDAIQTARMLIKREGIFCGISSGAAAAAALEIAREPRNEGKVVVFIAPDGADRYLSTALFGDEL